MISCNGFWESGRRNCWRKREDLDGLRSVEVRAGRLKLAGSIRDWAFETIDDHCIMTLVVQRKGDYGPKKKKKKKERKKKKQRQAVNGRLSAASGCWFGRTNREGMEIRRRCLGLEA